MITVKIEYKSNQSLPLDRVEDIITTFIQHIRINEPDTTSYWAYHKVNEPTHYVHLMTFEDKNARLVHQQKDYCESFVKKLHPLCEAEPEAIALEGIDKK